MNKSYHDFINTKIIVDNKEFSFVEKNNKLYIQGKKGLIPFEIHYEDYLFDALLVAAKQLIELEEY